MSSLPSGFDSWKDVLDVVAVPLAVAALALWWPWIQAWHRGRRFRLLVARELTEIGPYPVNRTSQDRWTDHLVRRFLHQKIINEVSENRDFILGLDPDFLYSLSQLWASFDAKDSNQWLWYLQQITNHRYLWRKRKALTKIRAEWSGLLKSYSLPRSAT